MIAPRAKSVKGNWIHYLSTAYDGENLPVAAVRDLKDAFYAGATTMILNIMDAEGMDTADDVGRYMQSLRDECMEYAEGVVEGGEPQP